MSRSYQKNIFFFFEIPLQHSKRENEWRYLFKKILLLLMYLLDLFVMMIMNYWWRKYNDDKIKKKSIELCYLSCVFLFSHLFYNLVHFSLHFVQFVTHFFYSIILVIPCIRHNFPCCNTKIHADADVTHTDKRNR